MNTNAVEVQAGQIWLRKRSSIALVRRVRAVEDGQVRYEVLHGPTSLRKNPMGSCHIQTFVQDSRRIEEQADYSHLDGARQFATFLVLNTQGEPLLRCSQKRAGFYLKKGFARPVAEGVLQFTDDATEKKLAELYDGKFTPFFLAVKNDACVCCGRGDRLTRHHVVPQRHKRKVPLPWRHCLSNVLFVCLDCHERYEQTPEPELEPTNWREYVYAWKNHFVRVMQPKFLPPGWDVVAATNMEAVARGGV